MSTLPGGLPFNLDDLLHARSVEHHRIEFKATWNDVIAESATRSICAFANDLLNLNGGYIILGVEERDARAQLPARGLGRLDLDRVQREVHGRCAQIQPDYQPLLFPAESEGCLLLVIQAPAGDTRPYQAPARRAGQRAYYVRQGSESVEARGDVLRQLLEQAGRTPFDDRRSLTHTIDHISASLVKRYLADVGSDLVRNGAHWDDQELYRRLRLVARVNAHEVPRNVAFMFFHEDPNDVFEGARIEVVKLADDAGGDLIEERTFKGPLATQVKAALDHLTSLWDVVVRKVAGQPESVRTAAYPPEAVEEGLVNAVFHRSYDGNPHPTVVRVFPDRLEITSYPGPVQGVRLEHLAVGETTPLVPARNRRIGQFLKELDLAEERGTGLTKIRRSLERNGSPPPVFDFDEGRTYFRVVLPIHPEHLVLHALRESSQMWARDQRRDAVEHLARAFQRQPNSGALALDLIGYLTEPPAEDFERAEAVLDRFSAVSDPKDVLWPYLRLAQRLVDKDRREEAAALVRKAERFQERARPYELMALGVLKDALGDFVAADELFRRVQSEYQNDSRFLHHAAHARKAVAEARDAETRDALYTEAAQLLRRSLNTDAGPFRAPKSWYMLATLLDRLGALESEVADAFERAIALDPRPKYRDAYAAWRNRRGRDQSL